jgi:tRNA-specific 2-thiouridylase
VFVKVRSTRAPQPAWLRSGPDGVEVELIEGESGVSPGQACVFYDTAAGQSRVLGGGIIKHAASAAEEMAVGEPRAAGRTAVGA